MGSYWSTPLGIAAIIFIIIGVIMAIAGIALLVVDKDVQKPWYIWTLLVGGAVLAIIGGIMLAIAYSRSEPKLVQSSYIKYDACGKPIPQPPMAPVLSIQESSPAIMYTDNRPQVQQPQYMYQHEMVGNPHYHTMSSPANPIPYNNEYQEQQVIRQIPVNVEPKGVQQPAYMVGVTKKDDSHVHFDPTIINTSSPGVEIPFVTQDGRTGRYVTDSENRQYVVPGSIKKANLYQGGVEVQSPAPVGILKAPPTSYTVQKTQPVFVTHQEAPQRGGMWVTPQPQLY